MAKMSVLVIGGAGYIGSHVAHELCAAGHEVLVYDNLSTGRIENLPTTVQFQRGDILDSTLLEQVFNDNQFDGVFHFAALKAAGESMTKPDRYAQHNIAGSINILNAMICSDVSRIIFSSSAAVYGLPRYLPVDEEHPQNPINFYGYTKLNIEHLLKWYSDLKGIRYAALRYFNAAGYDTQGRVRGKEKDPANLLPIVMETAAGERSKLQVYGDDYETHDGTCIRDYIHVNDLADAHLRALNYLGDQSDNLVLNLGTGRGYTVLEVIEAAKSVTGRDIQYEVVARRPGDAAELTAVSKVASGKLDWQPQNSTIEQILTSMWTVYAPPS